MHADNNDADHFCTKGQFIVKRRQNGFNGAQTKEEGKYQESIQSSSTLDPETVWESDRKTRKHHIQDSQEVSHFPTGDHKATRN